MQIWSNNILVYLNGLDIVMINLKNFEEKIEFKNAVTD